MKRMGPRIWLPLITLVWGIVATLQGVVVNNGGNSGMIGFFIVRFFLGITEGGLFPGEDGSVNPSSGPGFILM